MKYLYVLWLGLLAQSVYSAPYTGRLDCRNIDEILGWMNGHVMLQCELAQKACITKKNMAKLKTDDPLYPIIKERLEDYLNLSFEICELAILIYDRDYYLDHLKR
jgi:hypothetical protein